MFCINFARQSIKSRMRENRTYGSVRGTLNVSTRPFAHIFVLLAFMVNTFGPISAAEAVDFRLPTPGVMVRLSPPFDPPMLKGIKVHPDNPFHFDFVLDKGNNELSNDQIKDESSKLIKYFLASLTIPEKDLWVNLSPYEKDRIIPNSFGLTEMGRDLLAEDYMLKQITASLIYPEDAIGRKFWKLVYEEAAKRYGTTNIPVNTFNKVWIVPEKAVVYENAKTGTAYVVESKLKVMLEQDYLSLGKHEGTVLIQGKETNQLGSQIIREIVIPELTKEVNENKNFIQLRQVYNSLILATWYKKKIKDSILEQVYSDKNKVAGINVDDPQEEEKIYQQYLKAFKKGVYNYIREDFNPATQETIPRKYFSGGFSGLPLFNVNGDGAMKVVTQLPQDFDKEKSNLEIISGAIKPINVRPPNSKTSGSHNNSLEYLPKIELDEQVFDTTKYLRINEEDFLGVKFTYYVVERPELDVFAMNKNLSAFYSYSEKKKSWIIVLNKEISQSILPEVMDHELLEISIRIAMKNKKVSITEQEAHILASLYQRKKHSKPGELTEFDKWQISNMPAEDILKLINEDRSWHKNAAFKYISFLLHDPGKMVSMASFYEAYAELFIEALKKRYQELIKFNSTLSIKTQFSSHNKGTNQIAISPDGKFIAAGGKDGSVYILDSKTGEKVKELLGGHQGNITALVFGPKGETLASGDQKGNVNVWDLTDEKKILHRKRKHIRVDKPIEWLTLDESDKNAAKKLILYLEIETKGESYTYDAKNMKQISMGGGDGMQYKGKDNSIDYLSSGNFIFLPEKTNIDVTWKGHEGGTRTVVWAGDDERFLSTGNTDKKIKLWLKAKAKLLQEFDNPEGNVLSMVFLDGDKYFASADTAGRVVLWETDTGKKIDALQLNGPLRSLAITPDGKLIAAGDGKQISIIDVNHLNNSTVQSAQPSLQAVNGIVPSPDGKWVATLGQDGMVKLYNTTADDKLIQALTGHQKPVKVAAFNEKSDGLVTAGEDNYLIYWKRVNGVWKEHQRIDPPKNRSFIKASQIIVEDQRLYIAAGNIRFNYLLSKEGQYVYDNLLESMGNKSDLLISKGFLLYSNGEININNESYPVSDKPIQVFAVASSQNLLAVFEPGKVNLITVWEIPQDNGKPVRIYETGTTEDIKSMIFLSDEKILVTGNSKGKLMFLNITNKDGVPFQVIDVSSQPIVSLSIIPGTNRLWVGTQGGEINILGVDVNAPKVLPAVSPTPTTIPISQTSDADWSKAGLKQTLAHWQAVRYASFSPDGKFVVTASDDHTARIWDVETNKEIRTLKGHTWHVLSAVFSPDGKFVLTVSRNTVKIWDAQTGEEIRSMENKNSVRSASFSADGKLVITANDDGTARIWNAETAQEIKTLQGHKGSCFSAAFSPDGKFVVTTGDDSTLRIWDAQTGVQIKKLKGFYYSAAFSPDGKYIVTGDNKTAKIWNVETGKVVMLLEGHAGYVYSSSFSPDGKYVLTASADHTARIWDAQTGKEIKTLEGHVSDVYSAAFSKDGKYVVTASNDKTAKIWKEGLVAGESKEIVPDSSKAANDGWLAHEGQVNGIVASSDGKMIATLGQDGKVKLWDTANNKLIQELDGHQKAVKVAAFNKEANELVTSGEDNFFIIWQLKNGHWQENQRITQDEIKNEHMDIKRISQFKIEEHFIEINVENFEKHFFKEPNGKYVPSGSKTHAHNGGDKLFSGVLPDYGEFEIYSLGILVLDPDSHGSGRHSQSHSISYGPLKAFAVSPSERLLAALGANAIKVFKFKKQSSDVPDEIYNTETLGDVKSMAILPSEKRLVAGNADGQLVIWDMANKKGLANRIIKIADQPIVSLTIVPQTNHLLAGTQDGKIYSIDINELDINIPIVPKAIPAVQVPQGQVVPNSSVEVQEIREPDIKPIGYSSPAVNMMAKLNFKQSLLEIHPVTLQVRRCDYNIPNLTKAPPANPKLIDLWRKFRIFEQANIDVLALINKSDKTASDVHRLLDKMGQMVQIYEHLFKGQAMDRPMADIASDPNDLQGGKAIAQVFLLLKEKIEMSLKTLSSTTLIPESLDKELNRYDKGSPGKTAALIFAPAENYGPDVMNSISIAELINIVHQKGNRNYSALTGQISAVPQKVDVHITEVEDGKPRQATQVPVVYFDARSHPSLMVPMPVRLIALGLAKGEFIHGHYKKFILGTAAVNIISDERLATMNMRLGYHSCIIQFSPMPVAEGGRVVVQYTDSGAGYEPGSGIRVKGLAKGFQELGFRVRQEGYFFEAIFDKDTGAKRIDELPQKLQFALQALISTRDLDLDLEINHGPLRNDRQKSIDFLAEQLVRNGYIWRAIKSGKPVADAAMAMMLPQSQGSNEDDWKYLAKFLGYPVPAGHIGQMFMDGLLQWYKLLVRRNALLEEHGRIRWNPAYEEAKRVSPVASTLTYLEQLDPQGLLGFRQMGLVAQTIESFTSERQVLASIGGYTLEKMVLPTLKDVITFYVFKDEQGAIHGAWAVNGEISFNNNRLSVADLEELNELSMGMSQKMREHLLQLTGKEFNSIFDLFKNSELTEKCLPSFLIEDLFKLAKLQNQISPLSIGGKMTNPGFSLATVKFRTEADQSPESFQNAILIASMTDARDDSQMEQSVGIVVTTGGELSHAAIRGREFNKPSIILNGANIESGSLRFSSFTGEQKQQEHQFKGKTIKVFERSNYEQVAAEVNDGDLVAVDATKGMFYLVAKSQDQPALAIYDKYLQWKNAQADKEQPDTKDLQAILSEVNNDALLKAILMDLVAGQRLKPEVFETMIADYLASHKEKKEMLLGFILHSAQEAIQSLHDSKQLFDQMITQNNPADILIRVAILFKQIQAVRQLMAVANGQWILEMTPDQLATIRKDVLDKARGWLKSYRKNLKHTVGQIEDLDTKTLSFLSRKEEELHMVGLSLEKDAPALFIRMNQLKQKREEEVQRLAQSSTLSKAEIKDRWSRLLVGGKAAHSAEIGTALEILEKSGISIGLKVRTAEGFAVTSNEYQQWVKLGKPEDPEKAFSPQLKQKLFEGYRDIVIAQKKRIKSLLKSDERTSVETKDEITAIIDELDILEYASNAQSLDKMISMTRRNFKPFILKTDGTISKSLQKRLSVFGVVAARSSGINEDSTEESGAGTKRTVLGVVSCAKLYAAIIKVWLSGAESVLVEEMINAKKSIVAFSADPIETRTGQVRIVAAEGLAKGLVDHLVKDPDVYIVDDNNALRQPIHIGKKNEQAILDFESPDQIKVQEGPENLTQVLDEKEIKGVSDLIKNLAKYFGFFADMEASFDADGELVVLQIRPITTLTDTIHEGLTILDSAHSDSAMFSRHTGGIDLTPANMNLQTQNNGGEIKFHIDHAMFVQLQNATGFVPVIINIQPLKSLSIFLGLNQEPINKFKQEVLAKA